MRLHPANWGKRGSPNPNLIGDIRELGQDFGEDPRAGGHMLGARLLLLDVTEAVAARNKDHPCRTPSRHEFRVVRCSGSDLHVGQPETTRDSRDRRDNGGTERRRLRT